MAEQVKMVDIYYKNSDCAGQTARQFKDPYTIKMLHEVNEYGCDRRLQEKLNIEAGIFGSNIIGIFFTRRSDWLDVSYFASRKYCC